MGHGQQTSSYVHGGTCNAFPQTTLCLVGSPHRLLCPVGRGTIPPSIQSPVSELYSTIKGLLESTCEFPRHLYNEIPKE